MKKTLILIVLTLLSMEVFSQEWVSQFLREEWVSTSEGLYKCRMWYRGRNNGATVASEYTPQLGYSRLDKLSNGQLEAVRRMLNRYDTRTRETYDIFVEWQWRGIWQTVVVVVEFTSNTQFSYWAFMHN